MIKNDQEQAWTIMVVPMLKWNKAILLILIFEVANFPLICNVACYSGIRISKSDARKVIVAQQNKTLGAHKQADQRVKARAPTGLDWPAVAPPPSH